MSHPYMPLFVADYLGDTSHLTTLEHGAYMLLIMSYWQRGKALSADSKRLASIARMPADEWAAIEPTIAELFVVADGVWSHPRIEKELARAREKSTKARASAGRRHNGRTANDMPTQCEGSANAERTHCYPDPDSKEEKTTNPSSEQEPARVEKSTVDELIKGVGFGVRAERHGEITPETKRRVCQELNIGDAEPLVRVFEGWTAGKPAKRDRNAWFVKSAPTLWTNAAPAIRKACQPLDEAPPAVPVARASSSLASSKLVAGVPRYAA